MSKRNQRWRRRRIKKMQKIKNVFCCPFFFHETLLLFEVLEVIVFVNFMIRLIVSDDVKQKKRRKEGRK